MEPMVGKASIDKDRSIMNSFETIRLGGMDAFYPSQTFVHGFIPDGEGQWYSVE